MAVQRYALGVQYDGTRYCGWQRQREAGSVQATLEQALSEIADEPITVVTAGRTDAGVHALHQVVHFDSQADRAERAWTFGVNSVLPPDINVNWVQPVSHSFHARFSATWRRYQYLIYQHPLRSALWRDRSYWCCQPLAMEKMQQAAQYLVGQHDFSSFRAAGCQAKTAIRTIQRLTLQQHAAFILLDIQANAFLHHMVRNIVGSLVKVGREEAPPQWFAELLAEKNRQLAGITAPPQGLYLVGVGYGDTPDAKLLPEAQLGVLGLGF